jgi:hypothetical protein
LALACQYGSRTVKGANIRRCIDRRFKIGNSFDVNAVILPYSSLIRNDDWFDERAWLNPRITNN